MGIAVGFGVGVGFLEERRVGGVVGHGGRRRVVVGSVRRRYERRWDGPESVVSRV